MVEFNLKNETVKLSKKREPELENKILATEKNIKSFEQEITDIQRKILNNKGEIDKFEAAHEEITEKFNFFFEKSAKNELSEFEKPSKGILSISSLNHANQNFPNFYDDNLYVEVSVNDIENNIKCEGKEDFGCYSLKYLCLL